MKANELMIGDYISVKPSGMPIKIAAVHHKKVAYHAVVNKLFWVRESLLEPIPLTPEILEKNGLVLKEENESYLKFIQVNEKGQYIIILTIYKEPTKVTTSLRCELYFQEGINTIHSCFVRYVHQLQHALRLCAIIKEIEL